MSRSNGEVVVIAVETGDSRSEYRKVPGKKKKTTLTQNILFRSFNVSG